MFPLEWSSVKFSSSQKRIKWIFVFGPNSLRLTAKDAVHGMRKRSLDFPLPAWILMLSQSQESLVEQLTRMFITPRDHGTHEKRDEVLFSALAQDMDTNGFEPSEFCGIEFFKENPPLEMDVVCCL